MLDTDFDNLAWVLKALAHPTRLQIVEILQREPICVKNIGDCMDVQQANLSQHLSVLRNCGIVSTCREGNRVCYSIKDQRAVSVLRALKSDTTASTSVPL